MAAVSSVAGLRYVEAATGIFRAKAGFCGSAGDTNRATWDLSDTGVASSIFLIAR